MRITIGESITHAMTDCRLGYIVVENVNVRGTPPSLVGEFMGLQEDVAKAFNLGVLADVPRIAAVRNMFRKLDVDPARYRPASEALVRRVLQHKGLHFVNSAVDVNNFCSLKFLIPFGLYDLDKIRGEICYNIAHSGSYTNISGNLSSTEGKPFLTDEEGVFGNPTSDTQRTAVTLSTRNLLTVVYADEEVSEADLARILDFNAEMLVRHNGGQVKIKQIVHTEAE